MSTRTHWGIHYLSLILLCGMGLFIVLKGLVPSMGDGPPLTGKAAPDESEKNTISRTTHLIEMLGSRNAAPRIVGQDTGGPPKKWESAEIKFDNSYDKNLQVPVYLAMRQLLLEGESALELLDKHTNDERYCLSIDNGDNHENWTVGHICTRIYWAKILPFKYDLHFMTKDQYWVYPDKRGKLYKEWQEGKKAGLASIQIEAIDATINFLKNANAKNARPWVPYAPKVPPDEFETNRKKNIRMLHAIRETIVSTGKPYHPRTCLWWDERIIGLPW
jgi:hypothetical protein